MEQPGRLNFFDRKKHIIILVLFVTAFYCTLPLFIHQGVPLGHDLKNHIFRAEQFDKALHDGIIFPRWTPDANNGYGSPIFIFYSPLFYYVVSALHFIIPSLIMSMVIAVWFSFFLAGIAMFLLSKKMFGSEGGLLSAVAYQILPYHLIGLYVRATFAELFAFFWFPLIILFMHKTLERNTRSATAGLCISYAGLILTHLKLGFMFTFIIGVYLVFYYVLLKNKKSLINTLLALTLGLGISSFYLIPIIFERKFVHLEYIVNCFFCDFKENFLMMWSYVHDITLLLNIVLGLEIILLLVIILLIRANDRKVSFRQDRNILIIIFSIALFFSTFLSRPVWDYVPFFAEIQFPWRWLIIMELSLSLLIGCIFVAENRPGLRSRELKKRAFIYIVLIFLIISFVVIFMSKNSKDDYLSKTFNPEHMRSYMDPTFEYVPKWTSSIGEIMSEKRNEKVSVISGNARVNIIKWKSEQRTVIINASTPALLRISTFFYPGWEARLSGKRAMIKIERKTGAMLIDIPRGEHKLELKFEDTPLRYYSKLASLFSLFVIALLLFFRRSSREI